MTEQTNEQPIGQVGEPVNEVPAVIVPETVVKDNSLRSKWFSQSKTNRTLMISGSVLGITFIVLLVMFLTRPTHTPQVIAPVATTVKTEVVIVAFTATPTVVPTVVPTATPIVAVTIPAVVNTPAATSIPTEVSCLDDPRIIDEIAKLKDQEISEISKDRTFEVEYGVHNDTKSWSAYVLSTGKTGTKKVEIFGKTYIIHTLNVYTFGSNDPDHKIIEMTVAMGLTYPDGSFHPYMNPDSTDGGIIIFPSLKQAETRFSFGTLIRLSIEGEDHKGTNWNACINGSLSPTFLTPIDCQIGKQYFDNAKALPDLENGISPASDWIMMGVSLGDTTRNVVSATGEKSVTLSINMPACKP